MPETVAHILEDVRLIYADLPLATDAKYGAQTLRLLNKVHVALCEEFPLQTTSYDVPLVAGTREYEISESYKTIFSANYIFVSGQQPWYLYETSVDELDNEDPGWRTNFTGVPFRYYEWSNSASNPIVGFDPIPAATGSAGFPTVRLIVGVYTPLTATGTVPATIRSAGVYVDGLAYEWARYKGKQDLPMRKAMYEEARNNLGIYLGRKTRRLSPRNYSFMSSGVTAI